ncbi:MAG: hypothetical protein U0792_03750 [Gemmataceae bacterium]
MRTRLFMISTLLVGVVSAASVGGQPPEFKTFASSEGRYKAVFPGAVKTDTFPIKSEKGELTLTVDLVELRAGTSFMVTYVDTPAEVAKLPAEGRLDKVRDGNKGTDGKVTSDKPLTLGAEKHPGRDVLIEKPEGCIRNRIVIAGTRLYQVMVQGPKDVVTSPSADRFIDSFEITK